MRQYNYPLMIGGLFILMMLSIIIYGDILVKIDPYSIDLGDVEYKDGVFVDNSPPREPNEINILGTDNLGRDIFSRIIYGSRITLKIALYITLTRLLLALPFAFLSGFGRKISSGIIDFFSTAFNAIPALIFSLLILNFPFVKELELDSAIRVFVVVLTLVGWGRLSKILRDGVRNILQEDFIQGEIAIGKSKIQIALQNVLPHLTPTIIIHTFLEMSRALFMLASLGVFGVYVGKNKLDPIMIYDLGLDIMPNYAPEWGGMLATARYAIGTGDTWVALYPALVFFISILGFNLLGEGLKIEVSKRTSHVIPWIKRIPFHLSPKTYIYEIRHYKKYKKSFSLKTAIIVGTLVFLLMPTPDSLYDIQAKTTFSHVEEFAKDEYDGRRTGTEGRDLAGEYIAQQLKDHHLKPLFKEGYVKPVSVTKPLVKLKDSRLFVADEGGQVLETFQYRKHYNLSKTFEDKNIEAMLLTEEENKKGDYNGIGGYYVIMDDTKHPIKDEEEILEIALQRHVLGVIVPVEDDKALEIKQLSKTETVWEYHHHKRNYKKYPTTRRAYDPFIVTVDTETATRLREHVGRNMHIQNDVSIEEEVTFKNVGGMILGDDSHPKDTLVIITNYDYLGTDGDDTYKGLYYNGSSVAASLSLAKKLQAIDKRPNRKIIFLFVDGSKFFSTGAESYALGANVLTHDKTFYLTINNLGSAESNALYYDTALVSSYSDHYFEYAKYLEKRGKELGIDMNKEILINKREDISQFNNMVASGILVKGVNQENLYKSYGLKQEELSLVDQEHLRLQTQLLLDTIIHIAYDEE